MTKTLNLNKLTRAQLDQMKQFLALPKQRQTASPLALLNIEDGSVRPAYSLADPHHLLKSLDQEVADRITPLVAAYNQEDFRDGYYSNLSHELCDLYHQDGFAIFDAVLAELEKRVMARKDSYCNEESDNFLKLIEDVIDLISDDVVILTAF